MIQNESTAILILLGAMVSSLSVDCPSLINLARGLGFQSQQPNIWTALQGDCCASSSITCDVTQRIVQIHWHNMGLNGSINGSAIPSSLTYFGVGDNQLTGTVPLTWPAAISTIFLNSNMLTGTITLSWPVGLNILYLHRNQLTGDIPSQFSSVLQYLTLYNNKLTGDLPIFPSTVVFLALGWPGAPGNHFTGMLKLYQPNNLFINDNWITDVIIQDPSLLGSNCDLSNNPLLGSPNIVNLTMCIRSGLYKYTSSLFSKTSTTELKSVQTIHFLESTSMAITATLSQPSIAINGFNKTSGLIYSIMTSVSDSHLFITLVHLFSLMELFKMASRVFLDMIIVVVVVCKTPFIRELKNKLRLWQNNRKPLNDA